MLLCILIAQWLSVRMLGSSPPVQSSVASAMPVGSGRIDGGWPKTATLRAARRATLATIAAPIIPLLEGGDLVKVLLLERVIPALEGFLERKQHLGERKDSYPSRLY